VSDVLVKVEGLRKWFSVAGGLSFAGGAGHVQAVDDVSFEIAKGETLGLVGESGCGKTTVGRTMLRLYEPTAGKLYYDGVEVFGLSQAELLPLRRRMQMMFQDPYASLDPRMTVGEIIGEPLDIHHLVAGNGEKKERVQGLLRLVGLNPDHVNRYPHEFSGGQRQRIGFARALAVEPEFIVLDEPISALDVSIQAQMVNLLEDMQDKLGLTYLFIAHDLSMVKHISDRVAVMYLGKMMETAPSQELYDSPLHPYTKALLSAIPIPDPEIEAKRRRVILEGDVPSPIDPPSGCRFRTRCQAVLDLCAKEPPTFVEVEAGHWAGCHLLSR